MAKYRERLNENTLHDIFDQLMIFLQKPTAVSRGISVSVTDRMLGMVPLASPAMSYAKIGNEYAIAITDALLGYDMLNIPTDAVVEIDDDSVNVYEIDDRMIGLTSSGCIIDDHLAFRTMRFIRVDSIPDNWITPTLRNVMIAEYDECSPRFKTCVRMIQVDTSGVSERRIDYIYENVRMQILTKFNWKFSDTNGPMHIDVVKYGLPGDLTIEFDYHKYIAPCGKIDRRGFPERFKFMDALKYTYVDNCHNVSSCNFDDFMYAFMPVAISIKK